MKLLVSLLLAVNVALAIWIFTVDQTVPTDLKPILKPERPLALLSEREDVLNTEVEPIPSEEDKSPKISFVGAVCYGLGPFSEIDDVQEVVLGLADLGLEFERRYATRRELKGYWVYLPPFLSRTEARKMTKLLKSRGVKDFLIVPNGESENAISLGFFRTQSAAERHLANMQKLGLLPLLERNYAESSGFWLDFSSPKQPPLSSDAMEALQQQFEGIELLVRQCET